MTAELFQDVGTRMRIGRGSEREARHLGEGIHQAAQLAIVGAKIVAPFGHAVRLVHREQGKRGGSEQIAKARLAGAFGRDVEQIQRARAEPVDRLAPVSVHAGQRCRLDPVGSRGAKLVVHQRDERADHQAGARQHRRRKLVCQRLPRAGGHDRQGRLPGQHPRQNLRLHAAKIVETEQAAQFRPCLFKPLLALPCCRHRGPPWHSRAPA